MERCGHRDGRACVLVLRCCFGGCDGLRRSQ